VSLRDGVADVYPGGFRDYERVLAGRVEEKKPPSRAGKEEKTRAVASGEEEDKKRRFEEQRQAARAVEKKKRRIQELESSIAAGEKQLDVLRAGLKAAPGDDWEKLAKMAQEEQALTKKVDSMLVEWARLSEEVS
jgi:ATP-binding cassette subfamily F protein 3